MDHGRLGPVVTASHAAPPESSSWPNVGRMVAAGAAIGAAAGAFAALFLLVSRRREVERLDRAAAEPAPKGASGELEPLV